MNEFLRGDLNSRGSTRRGLARSFTPVALTSLACLGLLWGCAQFQRKAGPEIAKAINSYCKQPLEVRLVLREQVAELIAPNRARVDCEGDEK